MSGVGFTRGSTGRSDLARACRLGDPELTEYLAGLLGYRYIAPVSPQEPPQVKQPPPGVEDILLTGKSAPAPPTVSWEIPFWRAESFAVREWPPDAPKRDLTTATAGRRADEAKPKPVDLSFMPLSSNASLLTRLRAASPSQQISGELDVDRIVEEWGRGRWLKEMPRRKRRVWGRSVQVLIDRSRRLIPYWEDQDRAFHALRDTYPPEGFSMVFLEEGEAEPSTMSIGGRAVEYVPPPMGSALVALSDLGALAPRGSALVSLWSERGRRLRDLGVLPLAVFPCHPASYPEELRRFWTILPWERGSGADAPALSDEEIKAVVQRILTLLSFTLRIEPQLIRFVRRLLAAGRGDPGIEAWVWQHEAFHDPHCVAAELSLSQARTLRAALAQQDYDLRRKIYRRVEASHRAIYKGIWYAEAGNLANDELIDPRQLQEARDWFETQAERLGTEATQGPFHPDLAWHGEVLERFFPIAHQGKLGRVLHKIWSIVHHNDPRAVPPAGMDPMWLVPGTDQRSGAVLMELRQSGNRLIARQMNNGSVNDPAPPETRPAGSPIGLIRTRNGRLQLEPFDDFWSGGLPPAWANAWGWDEFGAWVELRVGDVVQRLRWIPPGTFWMGSPGDEEGRYSDEGPRHEETIESGFWMFDTPCTQALWGVVMGEGTNPSRFKGDDRPVECVSWNDCRHFFERLNARMSGLGLALPSEAQWEYACRAGMGKKTPRYRENLDEIAWYRDNSGGETHPVAKRLPNDWGLYDTLGNVWEWCANVSTDDYQRRAEKDAAESASARRVIRGGSWSNEARFVRAACRLRDGPSHRNDFLGFRCAELRAPGPVGLKENQIAERAGERGGVGAEHPGDRDTASGAGWINLDAPGLGAVSFTTLTPIRVRSDIEQVVLRTTTLPGWASAIGRDRYGLWAEFTIERNAAKASKKGSWWRRKRAQAEVPLGPVRQRLRWVPPGRFLMGSPNDEEGRWDGEGPQHEVVIKEGFWMFETPCTQALWEALMGENPSKFKSPDRPVEKVSWDDCQSFVKRINETLKHENGGLSLSLPSEAQWEYACRAGTTTATYAGPLKIVGGNNAPILHEIAWYGGNSGIEFELDNGLDASSWPEKQFEFDKAGTHPVARKKANPWGLHDMLGNVWEWCEDAWVEEYNEDSRAAASARRVIRGGSWGYGARGVRAAYRLRIEPSIRDSDLGFRCAEFRQGAVSRESRGSKAEGAEHPETATRRTQRRDPAGGKGKD